MGEFGIGRVPAGVDRQSELASVLDRMISPEAEARREARKTARCARCGMAAERNGLMSSSNGAICFDCFDATDGEG